MIASDASIKIQIFGITYALPKTGSCREPEPEPYAPAPEMCSASQKNGTIKHFSSNAVGVVFWGEVCYLPSLYAWYANVASGRAIKSWRDPGPLHRLPPPAEFNPYTRREVFMLRDVSHDLEYIDVLRSENFSGYRGMIFSAASAIGPSASVLAEIMDETGVYVPAPVIGIVHQYCRSECIMDVLTKEFCSLQKYDTMNHSIKCQSVRRAWSLFCSNSAIKNIWDEIHSVAITSMFDYILIKLFDGSVFVMLGGGGVKQLPVQYGDRIALLNRQPGCICRTFLPDMLPPDRCEGSDQRDWLDPLGNVFQTNNRLDTYMEHNVIWYCVNEGQRKRDVPYYYC